MCTADGRSPGSAAEALRLVNAGLDYLTGPDAAGLDGAASGEVLVSLGVLRAKLTAAHAGFLRRFGAAGGHHAEGYPGPASWLAARTRMTLKDARAEVRRMRQLGARPGIEAALAAGQISDSLSREMAEWTRKLPAELRAETEQVLLDAAAAGADLDDLATIAAYAREKWRSSQPDPGGDGFEDRYVRLGITFGGAGVIRGDLTPECAAAVQAVLEALGKKRGPEDTRTDGQRYHDALQEGCELLIRAKMVPDRAGADTHVSVHVPLSALREMPGASNANPLSPQAWAALRYAIARLAIDFVSGPGGIAAALRTGLLEPPFSTPSLPLDIGVSESIPAAIRRAVMLRDKHCAWPGGCDRPASASDVHHVVHKADGGPTSVTGCALYCQFHHDVCIHRWGWQIILHPDGTSEARSPDGRQVLRSHAPPSAPAA